MSLRCKALAIGACVAGLMGGSAAPAFAGTLDQEQTQSSTANGVGCDALVIAGCFTQAQTFTAGLAGALDQVDLYLIRDPSTTEPLTVEIRTVAADGCPSGDPGDLLASEQVAAADVTPGSLNWVPIAFSSPANVVPGTQYGIVLYTDGQYGVGVDQSDPYAGGRQCAASSFESNPTFNWFEPDSDFAFKTYVDIAEGPAPACGDRQATIIGTAGPDTLEGTNDADKIVGLGGDDEIRGLPGHDCLHGGPGADRVFGAAGDDYMRAGAGDDLLRGNRGGDDIAGHNGADRVIGGEGTDTLRGGPGPDVIRGGPGPDTIADTQGQNRIHCGGGVDTVVTNNASQVHRSCEDVAGH